MTKNDKFPVERMFKQSFLFKAHKEGCSIQNGVQGTGLQLYLKRHSDTGVFLWILKNF